jgi:hypothetical protein
MNRCLSCLAGVLCALVLAGCGSDAKPKPGATCTINSECNNPLSCTAGKCHEQCQDSRDCQQPGARCVKDNVVGSATMGVHVCQLPEEMPRCSMNSDCKLGLVCAKDLMCRNECKEDRDCPGKSQKCVELFCADPEDINPATGNTLKPATDAGVVGTGGAGGSTDGGSTGGAGGSATDGAAGGGGTVDGGAADVPNVPITVEVMADKATVRQGDLVTLTVTGPNVASPMNFEAGGYTVALQPGGTMNMFKASVAIPHGAMIGPKDFKFTTAAGVGEKKAAFTVTAITAGPMGDDNNRGTTDSPFKTFTKAITVASANDTVSLLEGKFSAGETWGKPIPDKITIVGASTAGTVLEGPGAAGGSVNADGFLFAGDATVKNLTVGYFNYNFHINKGGTIAIENVKAVGARYDGMYIDYQAMGPKVSITGAMADFTGNSSSSIQVSSAPGTSITISGGVKLGSMTTYGIQLNANNVSLTIDDASIDTPTNSNSIYASGNDFAFKLNKLTLNNTIQVASQGPMYSGSLDITNSTFTLGMNDYGIQFYGATLNITGTTFTGGYQQVTQNFGNAKVRGSKFMGYTYNGYIINAGKLDLGTATDPGTNELTGPDTSNAFGLYDSRALALDSITCSFTTFNGLRPDAGKVTSTAMTPVNVPGKYVIRTVGNSIEFF